MDILHDFDDLDTGIGDHLFVTDDTFDSPDGVLWFDPVTLRARVVDRLGDSFPKHAPWLQIAVAAHGPDVLRRLAIRLVRGMLMADLEERLPYDAVEALVEAAEDALEPGRTSYNFDRLIKKHREEIESAGLLDWMARGVVKYGAPPLLAAAVLLDENPWRTVRTAYDLACWLDDVVDDKEREFLYAPANPDRVVVQFWLDALDY